MENYNKFIKHSREVASFISTIPSNEKVKIISHLDADGITSASIMIKTLKYLNLKYAVSIVQQLTSKYLNTLSKEKYTYLIFTDLGSGSLNQINTLLKNKKVVILDHHHIKSNLDSEKLNANILHLNPFDYGIDGDKEISGSGVTFITARHINKKIDKLAHLALIGAVGDIQDKPNGLIGLNKKILGLAKRYGIVEVKKGLKIFGSYTRPIHKALQYSTELLIPNVTGSETGALNFLRTIGIRLKDSNNHWRTLNDLTKSELDKLITFIVLQKGIAESPEQIIGDIILLKDETEPALKDIREYATLLNACGRLNKPALGLGACLNQKSLKKRALDNLLTYRKAILNALNWFRENRSNKEFVYEDEHFIIINARYYVSSTIIGTLSSILSNSELKNKIILGLAYKKDNTAKISIRTNHNSFEDINAKEILESIMSKLDVNVNEQENSYDINYGGHKNAAGAYIPLSLVNQFIKLAIKTLKEITKEEVIRG